MSSAIPHCPWAFCRACSWRGKLCSVLSLECWGLGFGELSAGAASGGSGDRNNAWLELNFKCKHQGYLTQSEKVLPFWGANCFCWFPFPANARSGLLERHSQRLLDICHFRPLLDDLLLFGFFSNVTDAPAAIRQHFQKAGM